MNKIRELICFINIVPGKCRAFFILCSMSFVCYNGVFQPVDQPCLLVNNRSYKWGDGVFETIKVFKGRILLQSFHFERLLTSLQLLQMQPQFTLLELESHILALCVRNNCADLARVRLAVYRDEENTAGYTIEAIKLDQQSMNWNQIGLKVAIYPNARKACDVWANIKTANYLPYVMAARYAEEQGVNECFLLNSFNHICDASKANVFIIKGRTLYAPALDQGCINGVMRRFLLAEVKKHGWVVEQTALTETMLLQADECFLTNAIQGIRWVGAYGEKMFASNLTKQIFDTLQPAYLY